MRAAGRAQKPARAHEPRTAAFFRPSRLPSHSTEGPLGLPHWQQTARCSSSQAEADAPSSQGQFMPRTFSTPEKESGTFLTRSHTDLLFVLCGRSACHPRRAPGRSGYSCQRRTGKSTAARDTACPRRPLLPLRTGAALLQRYGTALHCEGKGKVRSSESPRQAMHSSAWHGGARYDKRARASTQHQTLRRRGVSSRKQCAWQYLPAAAARA